MSAGVFDSYRPEAFPFVYRATLSVENLCGGIPNDPKVIEGWLRTKIQAPDDRIRQMIAETMVERGVTADEAVKTVTREANVNGFKKNGQGLYIEGRQVKALLKEAASVAVAAGKISQAGYGLASKQGKFLTKFLPEHLFVDEDQIPIGADEPSGIKSKFIRAETPQGPRSALGYVEYVDRATLTFHVRTDWEWSEHDWAMLWLTAQEIGIGADRSQGCGRFTVTEWERVG